MSIEYTAEEDQARTSINLAMETIKNLDGPDSRLAANHEELAEAVHVLQSFLKQHVLHRLDPDTWSNWWEPKEPQTVRRVIGRQIREEPLGLSEAHEATFGDLKAA